MKAFVKQFWNVLRSDIEYRTPLLSRRYSKLEFFIKVDKEVFWEVMTTGTYQRYKNFRFQYSYKLTSNI